MDRERIIGKHSKRASKERPVASWANQLEEIPGIPHHDNSYQIGLFDRLMQEANGQRVVARLRVVDGSLRLPQDILNNGAFIDNHFRYYHRIISNQAALFELQALRKKGRVALEGFFRIKLARQ